ncbi:MAG TPA: GNAT family N-acetyltransferase [bacterium]
MKTINQSTSVAIRPFEERDYDGVVAVGNAVLPDRPGTVEEWRYDDDHYDKKCVNLRVVAEERASRAIVGYAGIWNVAWAFHPRKFGSEVRVHPQWQGRGIGSALWDRLEQELRTREALSVKTNIWETMPDAIRFAQARGFRDVLRAWESRLDVTAFDFDRFGPYVTRALDSGVSITTLTAERAKGVAQLERIHAMEAEISADIPRPPGDAHTPIDFSMFMEYAVDAPWAINDAYFLGVVDGEYAGLSALFKPKTGDWLNQGLTGVRRSFRGRHIASALKVKTVEYARDHGIREIRTWNEINNAAILAINVKYGFVRQPAWITFAKDF